MSSQGHHWSNSFEPYVKACVVARDIYDKLKSQLSSQHDLVDVSRSRLVEVEVWRLYSLSMYLFDRRKPKSWKKLILLSKQGLNVLRMNAKSKLNALRNN